jgi:hypothetical protein
LRCCQGKGSGGLFGGNTIADVLNAAVKAKEQEA